MGVRDYLDFEIYVMELCEKSKPKTTKEFEHLSDNLHQSIETAIADYIEDAEIECDYEPQY